MASKILVVIPLSVKEQWCKELEKWAKVRVIIFHGGTKKKREAELEKILEKGGVCITTYGTLLTNADSLAESEGDRIKWDYIICDEGHKIKNPSSKISKAIRSIDSERRILMTGTPILNKLKEMWALFDFVMPGLLESKYPSFSRKYEEKIVNGTRRNASEEEKEIGEETVDLLKKIISPYFLARKKSDIFSENTQSSTDQKER